MARSRSPSNDRIELRYLDSAEDRLVELPFRILLLGDFKGVEEDDLLEEREQSLQGSVAAAQPPAWVHAVQAEAGADRKREDRLPDALDIGTRAGDRRRRDAGPHRDLLLRLHLPHPTESLAGRFEHSGVPVWQRGELLDLRPRGPVDRRVIDPRPHLFGSEGKERGEQAQLDRQRERQGGPRARRAKARPSAGELPWLLALM